MLNKIESLNVSAAMYNFSLSLQTFYPKDQKQHATPELNETEAKMNTTALSVEQLNFSYVATACVDIIKLPLIDILRISIKPEDLWKKIKQCDPLMEGPYKLKPDQKTKCGCISSHKPPITPDYCVFDVTLVTTPLSPVSTVWERH